MSMEINNFKTFGKPRNTKTFHDQLLEYGFRNMSNLSGHSLKELSNEILDYEIQNLTFTKVLFPRGRGISKFMWYDDIFYIMNPDLFSEAIKLIHEKLEFNRPLYVNQSIKDYLYYYDLKEGESRRSEYNEKHLRRLSIWDDTPLRTLLIHCHNFVNLNNKKSPLSKPNNKRVNMNRRMGS